MRAAADERAAAAVEMHGLARIFGDGDVCRGLRRLLDIELAAAARRKELARQAGQGGEAGQGAEAGQVRPTRAQRRRAQRKRCAQRMRSGYAPNGYAHACSNVPEHCRWKLKFGMHNA